MNRWETPSDYLPAISPMPRQIPEVTTQSQAPQEQGTTAQHLTVRNYIDQRFWLYQTQQASLLFVDATTNIAFPPDAQFLRDQIKSIASYQFSICLSDKAINNAIAAIRGRGNASLIDHLLYIRVVDDNGSVTLQISNNSFVAVCPQSYQLYVYPVLGPGTLPSHYQPMWRPPRPHIEPTHLNPIQYSVHTPPAIDQLFHATNLPYDQRILILAWLVLCLMPNRQLILLELTGEPASGKTDLLKALLSLVDPQERMIRRPTRRKDIESELLSRYILALDAVEELRNDAQNLLVDCLDTFTYRKKRHPHVTFDIKTPVVINALESVVTDSELTKRTISIELPSLHEKGQDPGFVDQPFPERMPGALTGMLQMASNVLGALQEPRPLERTVPAEQIDYCEIGVIVADILENDPSVFWEQYDHNQSIQRQTKIDNHTVARAIQSFCEKYPDGIKQSVHDWLMTLEPYSLATEDWPRGPHEMAARLKTAAPLLRPLGYEIVRNGKIGSYGYWTIKPPKSEE